MRKQPITVPTKSFITISDVVDGLADRIMNISFGNAESDLIYPTKTSVVSGANGIESGIEVEMSDDTRFTVTITKGGKTDELGS